MKRLTEYSVASELRIAWRLATWPTSRCPSSVKATTDGVVRWPSALGITSAWPPSMVAATTELVVPRSIPTAFAMFASSRFADAGRRCRPTSEVGRWAGGSRRRSGERVPLSTFPGNSAPFVRGQKIEEWEDLSYAFTNAEIDSTPARARDLEGD